MSVRLAVVLCAAWLAVAGAGISPLAVHVSNALSKEDLAAVRRVAAKTLTELGEGVAQHRSFGAGGGSQTVLFLHPFLDSVAPDLRSRMQSLVQQVDETAGWGVVRGLALRARCAELIRYRAGEVAEEEGKIGWHEDGVTLVTVAAMLSEEGDFEGGGIRVSSPWADGFENFTLTRAGDAVAWRGWSEHAVQSIRSGTREVFVTEWWLGPDAAETQIPRGGDLPELAEQALELEPDSPMLYYLHARAVCKRLPCQDAEAARKAHASFLRALEILPRFERVLTGLGYFLLGGSWPQWAQGVARIRDGCKVLLAKEDSSLPSWSRWGDGAGCWAYALRKSYLSATRHLMGGHDEDEDEEEDESEADAGMRQLKRTLWVILALAAVGGIIPLLERLDGAAAAGPAGTRKPTGAFVGKDQDDKKETISKQKRRTAKTAAGSSGEVS